MGDQYNKNRRKKGNNPDEPNNPNTPGPSKAERKAQEKAQAQAQERELAQSRLLNEQLEKKFWILSEHIEGEKDLIKIGELKEEQAASHLKQLELQLAIKKDLTEEERVALSEQIKAARDLEKTRKKSLRALEDLEGQTANLVEQVTGISDKWSGGILANILKSEGGLKKFGQEISKSLSLTNILASSFAKVAQSTVGTVMMFDQAQSELASLTGQGGKYNNQIMQIAQQNRAFGAGVTRSAKAVGELHVNMLGFTNLGARTQNALAGMAIQLENFGISAAETGETMNELTKAFKMTVPEAADSIKGIVGAAAALNIPPSQMLKDYKASLPKLAHWGKESIKIFKKVAASAKGMGVEAQALLDMTEQYDTFEGAATAVGRLNAIMGGNMLNAYQMLNANEEERIALILEAKDATGKSWKEMDRFERKAFASAAGVQSMADAAKIFGQTASEYRAHQEGLKLTEAEQAKVEARSKAAISVQQKWGQVMESFAILITPVVDKLHSFLNEILSGDTAAKGMMERFSKLLGVLWTFGMVIGAVSGSLAFHNLVTKLSSFSTWANTVSKNVNTFFTKESSRATWLDIKAKFAHIKANIGQIFSLNGLTVAFKALGLSMGGVFVMLLVVVGVVMALYWAWNKLWDAMSGGSSASSSASGSLNSFMDSLPGSSDLPSGMNLSSPSKPNFSALTSADTSALPSAMASPMINPQTGAVDLSAQSPGTTPYSAPAQAQQAQRAAPVATPKRDLVIKLYIDKKEIGNALYPDIKKLLDNELWDEALFARIDTTGQK